MNVHVSDQDGVAVVKLDDGKLNALSREMIADAEAAIDDLGGAPFVLTGNDKALSAGLDRGIFAEGRDGVVDIMVRFGGLTRKVFLYPGPVVVAARGHAIAGGAFLALSGDWVVACEGDGNWGLIETAIGMTLPRFAVSQAQYRLGTATADRLMLSGRSMGPAEALEVGLVDEVVPADDLVATAAAKAAQLGELARRSYGATKQRARAHLVEADEAAVMADLNDYFDASPIFDGVR